MGGGINTYEKHNSPKTRNSTNHVYKVGIKACDGRYGWKLNGSELGKP